METRRGLCPGGIALMACLAPQSANDTNRPEYSFFLREASEWDKLCRVARFAEVRSEELETAMTNPDGTPLTRYSIRVTAWT